MRHAALLSCVLAAACGGSSNDPGPDAATSDVDASGAHDPTAAELLAAVSACDQLSAGLYATDEGEPATIPVCGVAGTNVVTWTSDMDIDCDGKESAQCNLAADPAYQPETAATDSVGDPLDAAALPYVVVPSPSGLWDYQGTGLELGDVFAVVYAGQVKYAVFGDTGPTTIIGEGSYALAAALGIDPDPSFGGTDSGVTFIGFTGAGAIVDPIEDPAVAAAVGVAQARALVGP